MNDGWICLHRKILDHPLYKDSQFIHIWIYLLLNATHKHRKARFKGETIELKPGQLITGRLSISKVTGVHPSKVQRVLKMLNIDHQIEQQACNVNSLITIVNWDRYQKIDHQSEQPAISQRSASDHKQQCNKETKEQVQGVGANGSHPTTNESDWLDVISKAAAYADIDTKREFSKLEQWCKINRQKPTKRRFLAWLNRIEAPMKSTKPDHSKGFGEWKHQK